MAVRAGPSRAEKILAVRHKGDEILVAEERDGWVRISEEDDEWGWHLNQFRSGASKRGADILQAAENDKTPTADPPTMEPSWITARDGPRPWSLPELTPAVAAAPETVRNLLAAQPEVVDTSQMAWMLVDGAEAGLGLLLERVL